MAGMDQNRMIRSKELHVMLREVVADGGGGAMLISCKGAILASAGFDQAEPKIVSAIAAHVWARAGKECEIPNFKGSSLGRFPLVSADFWTSDHLSERPRSVGAFSGTRARGTLTLKRT